MPKQPKRKTAAPESEAMSNAKWPSREDQLWCHYNLCLEILQKACVNDTLMAERCETKIRAKRVSEQWDAAGRSSIDVFRLAGAVDRVKLDGEDTLQIQRLIERRTAVRDQTAVRLGKLDGETWGVFCDRIRAKTRAGSLSYLQSILVELHAVDPFVYAPPPPPKDDGRNKTGMDNRDRIQSAEANAKAMV